MDVGHGVTTCCAVWQGRECAGPLSCSPVESHALRLAEMVSCVIASCSEEVQSTLRHNVVLAGTSNCILYKVHNYIVYGILYVAW